MESEPSVLSLEVEKPGVTDSDQDAESLEPMELGRKRSNSATKAFTRDDMDGLSPVAV